MTEVNMKNCSQALGAETIFTILRVLWANFRADSS